MPFFAPEGYTITFFQGHLLYKHPWTNRPEQRQPLSLLIGMQDTCGELSPKYEVDTIIIPLTNEELLSLART